MTITEQLIAYEDGSLSPEDSLALFSTLVTSGLAWGLQGSYGRTARRLIEDGWISPEGVVLRDYDFA